MRFLVDAQLPPALARWLEAQGYRAAHVSDLEMSAASDVEIWRTAAEQLWVIVTKDEDFALWRVRSEDTGPAVIWLRIGNTRKAELLRWLEPLLPDIAAALESGEKLVEVD